MKPERPCDRDTPPSGLRALASLPSSPLGGLLKTEPHRTYGYTQSAFPHNSRSTLLRRPDPAGRKCRAARRGRRTAADARGHASRCESIAPAAQYPISLTGGGARSKLAGNTLCNSRPQPRADRNDGPRHSRGHAPPPASRGQPLSGRGGEDATPAHQVRRRYSTSCSTRRSSSAAGLVGRCAGLIARATALPADRATTIGEASC